MTATRGWGLSEQHLALEALVAFVDGELSPGAHDRAAAHLARCRDCADEATAQRQARTVVRSAKAPAMPPQLLQALQSIPTTAELPGQPEELALSEDGQLVTVQRRTSTVRPLGTGAVLGSSTPLGRGRRFFSMPFGGDKRDADDDRQARGSGRRTRPAAGVVFSGLVLGALALMNVPTDEEHDIPNPEPPPFLGGGVQQGSFVPAKLQSSPGGPSAQPPTPSRLPTDGQGRWLR